MVPTFAPLSSSRTPEQSPSKGHVIFITGVISSGKTTLARALEGRTTTFRVITGDDEIIEIRRHRPRDLEHALFLRLLHRVKVAAETGNVILDMILPQSYVEEAREAFGSAGLFVGLRLSEEERRARESSRPDRGPRQDWTESRSALRGPDDLYDLNLDSGVMSPEEMAEAIVLRARDHWPDLVL